MNNELKQEGEIPREHRKTHKGLIKTGTHHSQIKNDKPTNGTPQNNVNTLKYQTR